MMTSANRWESNTHTHTHTHTQVSLIKKEKLRAIIEPVYQGMI